MHKLIRDGVLFQDKKACLYIYAQEMQGARQFGIVGGVSVAEYERGTIKKHELTREDKELDRTRHVNIVNAHTGPVFIAYRARPALDRLVAEEVAKPPEYEFTAEDGVSHAVWILDADDKIKFIVREFAEIGSIQLIAAPALVFS